MKRYWLACCLVATAGMFLMMPSIEAQETRQPQTQPKRGEPVDEGRDISVAEKDLLGSRALPRRINKVFSLQDITLMTLKNNLDVKIKRINPRIVETRVESAESVFDPTVEASVGGGQTDSPSFDTGGDVTHGRSKSLSGSVELNKRFATGASAGVGLNATDTNPSGSRSLLSSEVELSVSQPLLQGAGVKVNRADIHIARNNTRLSQWQFKDEVIATIARTQRTYWELVYALENLDVRKRSWRLSKKTLFQTQAQVEAGVLARIEITRVRADVASKEDDIIRAQRLVEDWVDQLRRLIREPGSELAEDVGIVPLSQATYTPVDIDLMKEIRTALACRPDYLQARIDIENSDLELVKTRNEKLPKLDLAATLELNGLGRNMSGSIDRLGRGDHVDWNVGATLTYPLGNRAAKSSHTRAQLAKKQSLLRLSDLEDKIIIQVKRAVRKAETDLKRIRSTQLARQLAAERLAAEEEKLKVGQVIILDVLEATTLLAETETAERRVIVDYNNSLIALEQAKGTLLEANNIYVSKR